MRKKKMGTALFVAAAFLGISATALDFTPASAGMLTETLLDDSFSSLQLDEASWYSSSFTGISLGEGYTAYTTRGPYTGTGLSSKSTFTGGGAIEVDVTKLDWSGNSGNLWLVFGDYNEPFADDIWTAQKADGIKINFNKDASPYALRMSSQYTSLTGVVDGNGELLPTPTPYAFTEVAALSEGNAADLILRKTLRFEYGADGSFALKMKELGSEEPFTTVAENGDVKLKPFAPDSKAYVFFDEAGGAVKEGEFSDMRVYDNEGTLVASFGEDPAASFDTHKHSSTEFASLGSNQFLVFDENYQNDKPLFASKNIYAETDEDIAESVATAEAKMSFRSFKGDKRFGLLLGAEKQSSGKIGEKGSSFLYFASEDDGYVYGMETYGEDGEKSVVIEERPLPAESDDFTLKLETGSGGTLKVSFDGVIDYSADDADFSYAGYMGFAMDGAETNAENCVKVLVDSFSLKNVFYDRPENTNIVTDFSDNEFNTNLWQLSSKPYMSTYTNGVYVKDEMLYFDNVAMNSYLSTKFRYSNFSMEYSIVDVRREAVMDEASGEPILPVSSWIGVVFGASTPNDDFGKMVDNIPLVYLEVPVNKDTWQRDTDASGKPLPARLVISGVGTSRMIDLPEKYDFWALENAGKVLNVSIKTVDGQLTVALKYSTENEYTVVAEQTMSSGVSGHIYICGMGDSYFVEGVSEGASCGNFVIDDISVTNLDSKGNILTDVEFESNKNPDIPGDYEYTGGRDEKDYRPQADVSDGGCSGEIGTGATLSAIMLGGAAVHLMRRKQK
mgnify:CR=1 FL=1